MKNIIAYISITIYYFYKVTNKLNQYSNWIKLKIWMWIGDIIVSWWLWYLTWMFIPDSLWDLKFILIPISWFLFYLILDILEKKL